MLALGTLGACSGDSRPSRATLTVAALMLPVGGVSDTLVGRVLADSNTLAAPRYVSATDDMVVVAQNTQATLLKLFDRRSGRFLGAVGAREPERGVYLRAGALTVLPKRQQVQMFDQFTSRLVSMGIGDSAGTQTSIVVDTALSILETAWLPGGRFAGVGLKVPGSFALFAADGARARTVGPPPQVPATAPLFVRQHVGRTTMTISPKGDRVVLLGHYSDALVIYDTLGHVIASGERSVRFDPEFDVAMRRGAPSMQTVANTRIGYINAASTTDAIFALYSGRAVGARGARAFYGNHVLEFGWDGQLRRVHRLQGDALAIAVTPDGKTLLTIQDAPRPNLTAYSLSPSSSPLAGRTAALSAAP